MSIYVRIKIVLYTEKLKVKTFQGQRFSLKNKYSSYLIPHMKEGYGSNYVSWG